VEKHNVFSEFTWASGSRRSWSITIILRDAGGLDAPYGPGVTPTLLADSTLRAWTFVVKLDDLIVILFSQGKLQKCVFGELSVQRVVLNLRHARRKVQCQWRVDSPGGLHTIANFGGGGCWSF
jgi:hypothetical protein